MRVEKEPWPDQGRRRGKSMKEEDEIIIRTNGVKVNFGDFWALKGIDMEVRKGEIIVVLGPSRFRQVDVHHAH